MRSVSIEGECCVTHHISAYIGGKQSLGEKLLSRLHGTAFNSLQLTMTIHQSSALPGNSLSTKISEQHLEADEELSLDLVTEEI